MAGRKLFWLFLTLEMFCSIGRSSTDESLEEYTLPMTTSTPTKADNSCSLSILEETAFATDPNILADPEDNIGSNVSNSSSGNHVKSKASRRLLSQAMLRMLTVGHITITIMSITGCIGSALTVLLLVKGVLKSSASVYMIALAASDFLLILINLPQFLNNNLSLRSLESWKIFYTYYDIYVSSFGYIFHSFGVWVTMFLTIERYIAVCFPIKMHIFAKESRARIAVISLFFAMVALNVSQFFRRSLTVTFDTKTNQTLYIQKLTNQTLYIQKLTNQTLYIQKLTNQTLYIQKLTALGNDVIYTKAMYWVYALITVLIPFPAMVILNSAIVVKLRNLSQERKYLSVKTNQDRDNQITRILIGVVVAFLLCNIVHSVRHVQIALVGSDIYSTDLFTSIWIGGILAMFNPTANFALYVCFSQTVRNALGKMVINLFYCRAVKSPSRAMTRKDNSGARWQETA